MASQGNLHRAGLVKPAPRRSAHRKKRPRRPLPGMLLHQDASRHAWLDGAPPLDLVVTLDDATSAIYSAFLVEEEGTASSFRGLAEVVATRGLFCALYTDRGSHYFHTPQAGGTVSRTQPTQVGRALAQLGIEHIAAYSPEARGRSERAFRTLQERLPKELRLAGITGIEAANRSINGFVGALVERFGPLLGQQRRGELRRRQAEQWMPPHRRELGQRLEDERAKVHARVRKKQTCLALDDGPAEGEQIEVKHPSRVRRASRSTEIRFHTVQRLQQRRRVHPCLDVEDAVDVSRLIGRRYRGAAIPSGAAADDDPSRRQCSQRRRHHRQRRAERLTGQVTADADENVVPVHSLRSCSYSGHTLRLLEALPDDSTGPGGVGTGC